MEKEKKTAISTSGVEKFGGGSGSRPGGEEQLTTKDTKYHEGLAFRGFPPLPKTRGIGQYLRVFVCNPIDLFLQMIFGEANSL